MGFCRPRRPGCRAMVFLRSFRSGGMLSQRGPRFPRRPKDRPDCSACRDGTPSPSRLRAYHAAARYLDWRSETDMTDGNKPQSLRPNTKILRPRTDRARRSASNGGRQQHACWLSLDFSVPSSSWSTLPLVDPAIMQTMPMRTLRLLLSNLESVRLWPA